MVKFLLLLDSMMAKPSQRENKIELEWEITVFNDILNLRLD